MGISRKNTVVVDFNVLPKRPSPGEVQKFIRDQLKLDMSMVRNLQMHSIRHQTLIEMASLEAAERLASTHNMKHYLEVEKKKYIIPVFIEDMAINVRVHDLPPDMSNAEVADHMKKYGKVKSVVREVWKKYFPGTLNGVRVVRIELKEPIPSYIRLGDDMSMVTYKSQIATCLHCGHKTHPKMKCSEATSRKTKTTSDVSGPSRHAE
ncbi:hypothetical protein RP20_CCG009814 [Aedes albopictus]|nr:hypothetical protein RP20_CCG009814 [Aedes albopictus]